MKQLKSAIETVYSICAEQRYQEKTGYRKTRHFISVPCDEGTLLFHTLTGELLLQSQSENEEENREQLVKSWFLVPESFNECEQADTVFRIAAMLNPFHENKTKFTVLTTTDCNARCFYCYERGIPRFSMNEDTATDVGLYIARVCSGEPVSLSWFGGEPLYNRKAIEIICAVLRDHDIEYSSILTSNGYYLDEAMSKKAVEDWHIRSAQITLDGTETIYNRTKAYLKAEGNPFARVLDNIEYALDAGIHVSIRLNMDRKNAEDLLRLIDLVGQRYGRRENLSAHVVLLSGDTGSIHEFTSAEEAIAWRRRLNERLDELGYLRHGTLPQGLQINRCMADNPACEVILPDGRIQRCEHYDEAEIVGSIYNEIRDEVKYREWGETTRYPACAECAMYPMCVPLKRCPWRVNGCSEQRRVNLYETLVRTILSTYQSKDNPREENVS